MGYHEIRCRLCGVAFNINRIRRADEPPSAGWKNNGDGLSFVQQEKWDRTGCPMEGKDNGSDGGKNTCQLVNRRTLAGVVEWEEMNPFGLTREPALLNTDDGDDLDYVPVPESEEEKEEEYERYEYESEDSNDDKNDKNDNDDHDSNQGKGSVELEETQDEEEDEEDDEMNQGSAFIRNFNSEILSDASRRLEELHAIGKFWRYDGIYDEEFNEGDELVYEHVAGPDCCFNGGYSGYKITPEQMRGCNVAQCLRPKPRDWTPRLYDQPFEQETDFVLSGLTNYIRSTDSFGSQFRRGLEDEFLMADNDIARHTTDINEYAMPFHPTCFDVYMRLSRKHSGHVDLTGLMGFYHIEGRERKYQFHEDVKACQFTPWPHNPGQEFFAANPLLVPGLAPLLKSAIETDTAFNARTGAFPVVDAESSSSSLDQRLSSQHITNQDLFETLPSEIKLELISYLGSKDIASLRLVSRSFRQLPIYIWRRLVKDEMPWLWEVWSDNDEPYIWALVSHDDLLKDHALRLTLDETFNLHRDRVRFEIPEVASEWADDWAKNVQQFYGPELDLFGKSQAATTKLLVQEMPHNQINWYRLYTEITRNWKDLKGLQNRRRIWAEIENVISQIQTYREEGRISA